MPKADAKYNWLDNEPFREAFLALPENEQIRVIRKSPAFKRSDGVTKPYAFLRSLGVIPARKTETGYRYQTKIRAATAKALAPLLGIEDVDIAPSRVRARRRVSVEPFKRVIGAMSAEEQQELCRKLKWFDNRGVVETRRLRRVVGLAPYQSRGKWYTKTKMQVDTASALLDVLPQIDPEEVFEWLSDPVLN